MMLEKISRQSLALVAIAMGLSSSAAFADGNGVYATVEAGVARIDFPTNRFFAVRGEAAPFARTANLRTEDDDARGNSLGGSLGIHLPGNPAGSAAMRLELRAWSIDAEVTNRASFVDPGPGVRYGWVTLDNSTGFGTPNGTVLKATIAQQFDYRGGDLLFLLDYKHRERNKWTLYAGPSIKSLDQKTEINGVITTSVTLAEKLSTDFKGMKVGVRYEHQFDDHWDGVVDLSASSYRSTTKYRGNYADSTGNSAHAELREKDHALGLDARVEVSRRIHEAVKVSAIVGLGHLSDVPRVSYGSVPTDPERGVLSLTSASQSTWFFGIGLNGSF